MLGLPGVGGEFGFGVLEGKTPRFSFLKERVVLGLFPWNTNTSQRKKWAGKAGEKSQ